MFKLRLTATLVLLLAAGSAAAHPGHEVAGFLSGLVHPLSGLDHLLAMCAVGLYAAGQPGRQRWALPTSFVAMLVVGAALGAWMPGLPMIEAGIATSVLVLGLLIALAARLAGAVALPMVAVFALFHGYAHGSEAGAGALALYASGVVVATACLLGLGFTLADWLPESAPGRVGKRALGGGIALTGLLLLGG